MLQFLVSFTSDDPTAQSRDTLYLRHIVLDKVVITLNTAHVAWQAEPFRQLTWHCNVLPYYSFSTHVRVISNQSPVAQHADPTMIMWIEV